MLLQGFCFNDCQCIELSEIFNVVFTFYCSRERERLLHPLERQTISTLQSNDRSCPVQGVKQSKQYQNHIADPLRTIKAFSRSAAGHKMPQPADLRPFPVLDMTVTYLIEK